VRELQHFGVRTQLHDPMAVPAEAEHEYGMKLTSLEAMEPADAVILAVAHSHYTQQGWTMVSRLLKGGRGTVLDVKSRLDRAAMPDGVDLWRL